jgi:hypothetical protein
VTDVLAPTPGEQAVERHLRLWEEARGRFLGFDPEEDRVVVRLAVGRQEFTIPIPASREVVQFMEEYLKKVPIKTIVGVLRTGVPGYDFMIQVFPRKR